MGILICLASGANTTSIGSGVVAVVTATLSANSSVTLDSLSMSNVFGTLANGTDADITGPAGQSASQIRLLFQSFSARQPRCRRASSSRTASLSQPAPAGAVITISDNNSSLSFPASATVAAASTKATFQVTAQTLSSSSSAVITISYSGSSATASVTIMAPSVSVSAVSL